MPTGSVTIDELAGEIALKVASGGRILIGVVGTPGAEKSTAAQALVNALDAMNVVARMVPIDGYHLADVSLIRLDRLNRKGAVDTYDGHGYVSMLRRLRTETENTVFAPGFDRDLEQPIAGAIAVEPGVQVVITEGNCLLVGEDPWSRIPALLSEVLYVDLDDDERMRRLIKRHVEFGKTPEHARAWVETVDEPNARMIESTRARASRILMA